MSKNNEMSNLHQFISNNILVFLIRHISLLNLYCFSKAGEISVLHFEHRKLMPGNMLVLYPTITCSGIQCSVCGIKFILSKFVHNARLRRARICWRQGCSSQAPAHTEAMIWQEPPEGSKNTHNILHPGWNNARQAVETGWELSKRQFCRRKSGMQVKNKWKMSQKHALAVRKVKSIPDGIIKSVVHRIRKVIFPLYSALLRLHLESCVQFLGLHTTTSPSEATQRLKFLSTEYIRTGWENWICSAWRQKSTGDQVCIYTRTVTRSENKEKIGLYSPQSWGYTHPAQFPFPGIINFLKILLIVR